MAWLSNLRISSKISLIVLLMSGITITTSAFTFTRMIDTDRAYRDLISRIDAATIEAAGSARQIEAYVSFIYQLAVEKTGEGHKRLFASLQQTQSSYLSALNKLDAEIPERTIPVTALKRSATEMFDACDNVIQFAASTTGDEGVKTALARVKTECASKANAVLAQSGATLEELIQFSNNAASNLQEQTSSTIVQAAAAVASGLVIGFALSIYVGISGLSRPIIQLKVTMESLSQRMLTVAIPGVDRRDELGDMARTLESFKTASLEVQRLTDEQKQADHIRQAQRRADMEKIADGFNEAVGDIVRTVSAAATELEASAHTLTNTAATTEQISRAVSTAAELASTNVQSVASSTEEMASSVQEINRQVHESARVAASAVSQAVLTNTKMRELSHAASKIGAVIDLINKIAGQTNLLALNATIEAARAGEAGRGFAVVASEVKSLAEQTARATEEIADQIKSVQLATSASEEAINAIGTTIENVSGIATAISAAVEQQGIATGEIARNIQLASRGTSEVAANVSEVQRGSSETGSASAQVLLSAKSLSIESARLKHEVAAFLDSVRAA